MMAIIRPTTLVVCGVSSNFIFFLDRRCHCHWVAPCQLLERTLTPSKAHLNHYSTTTKIHRAPCRILKGSLVPAAQALDAPCCCLCPGLSRLLAVDHRAESAEESGPPAAAAPPGCRGLAEAARLLRIPARSSAVTPVTVMRAGSSCSRGMGIGMGPGWVGGGGVGGLV